jgi:3-oxoacyl-[acyl-carrier-protein] synthase II
MLKFLPNMHACQIGIAHQAFGPNNTVVQGEVSSLLAIAEATTVIQRGWADVMIAGGGGTSINPTRCVYLSVDNLSRRAEDPAGACRPFDADRDGKVLGEGAAAFVLEERAHAVARGAVPLAEITGFGRSFDPQWTRHGGPSTEAIARSIRWALASAACESADVGHVNAHGLATREADQREAAAIRQELGDTPVTAPKSYFGCLSAGSGAVELAASVMALHTGRVPATLNYRHPDSDCPIRVVHGAPLQLDRPVAVALNQSGTGQTAALVLRRAPQA